VVSSDLDNENRRLRRRLERERKARRVAEEIAEKATRHALYDGLTEVANRTLFMDRLALALSRAERNGGMIAVLFVDLDRFKLVNDSYGHEVGDAVLVEVARRLRQSVRPHDTVGRAGGDEFTILCEDIVDREAGEHIARRIVQALAPPIAATGRPFYATVSVGLIVAEGDYASPDDIVRDADAAMYAAKRLGRDRYEVFDEAMRVHAMERMDTERELHRAIARGEFVAYYQPIVDLRSGLVSGVEALLRWQHPERGLVAPAEFIPVCEDTGMIVPLGEWALGEACRQVQRWNDALAGNRLLAMSVNVSSRQLTQPTFAAAVAETLEATGCDPRSLCLEITEHVIMSEAEACADNMRDLVDSGVRLSLDDFGKGYSSLSYLKRLPVSTLKIDRSFIAGLGDDPEDSAIVAAIIALARALRLATVAEGIETHTQYAEVRKLGCDFAQGYFFSPPVSAAAMEPLLERDRVMDVRLAFPAA
jgi:diguanylate cyclase (GGDEF)-like protein